MTSKSKKRSEAKGERTQRESGTPQRQAANPNLEQNPEHRYRSQRTDLLEGDPAGTAFSEEMGHTPTRE